MTKQNKKVDLFGIIYKNSLLFELLVICIIFQSLSGGIFLSTRNLSNLLLQGATCSIIAITMCLVIITCNADLSAGRLLGMFGMIGAIMQVSFKCNSVVVVIAIYVLSILIGLWHGFWIGYMKLPAFIITLATQLVFFGVNQYVSDGKTIGPVSGLINLMGNQYIPHISADVNDTSLMIGILASVIYLVISIRKERKTIRQGLVQPRWKKILPGILLKVAVIMIITMIVYLHQGFSYSMLILFALTLIVAFIIDNTKFGRYIYAIGGNADAAKLSGINVPKETVKLYVLHAVVVATAALVYLGRVGQASTAAGNGYEFTAITGCVVGGTAITGGRGSVIGAVVGTMIMAGLDNGMSLLNLPPALQYVVRGCVLLFAIGLDAYANSRKAKTIQQA